MASTRNVDEGSVEKKFMSAKGTQESIQGISMWALNHKTQHEQIVEIWLSVLKKCENFVIKLLIFHFLLIVSAAVKTFCV